jgi:NAD(P)-dependent dehydrogenase (short-subunit alcohol dehydrogenase family)
VAVVTGGAVRVGRELCMTLAESGVCVCVHYSASHDAAERTVRDIRAAGGDAMLVRADLTHPLEAAQEIISAAASAFGQVDILVNNAAIFEPGSLDVTTPADWDRHQRINLQAPVFLCQRFARQIPDAGHGAIINLADWRALRPQPGHLAYTLSKAGIVCLTRLLALELAPRIRVNAIAPGAILPPPLGDADDFAKLSEIIPLHRTGAPRDIAGAAMFLLQNDFVTGEVLHVTGGQHLPVRTPAPPPDS